MLPSTEQPSSLIHVPLHPILDLLRRIAHEMVRLALHRPDSGVLKEEPVVSLVVFLRAADVADLVVFVVLVDQVLSDTAGLEHGDGPAAVEGVGNGGDAAIGVDLEEPRLLLRVFGYVEVDYFVRQAEEFKGDRDLDAIGCLVGVECDVR